MSLFDVARTFSRRVPLGKLMEIEPDLRPYLAAILVSAVQQAHEILRVPSTLAVEVLSPDEFQQHVLRLATTAFKPYGQILHRFHESKVDPIAERDAQRDRQILELAAQAADMS